MREGRYGAELMQANRERGEDCRAILIAPAVECLLDMFEAGLKRHSMPRHQHHLRRMTGKTFKRR